jgi:hypothetical protein
MGLIVSDYAKIATLPVRQIRIYTTCTFYAQNRMHHVGEKMSAAAIILFSVAQRFKSGDMKPDGKQEPCQPGRID